jgi:hypothetical protein
VVVGSGATAFFLEILVLPVLIADRSPLPRRGVVDAADLLLSRIVLPIRSFSLLSVTVLPPRPREAAADFDRAETEGALLRV